MARFLFKGNAEWTLDVGALSESFAKEEESKTSESGLSYGDYLRILLYLTGQEKLTYRANESDGAEYQAAAGPGEFSDGLHDW